MDSRGRLGCQEKNLTIGHGIKSLKILKKQRRIQIVEVVSNIVRYFLSSVLHDKSRMRKWNNTLEVLHLIVQMIQEPEALSHALQGLRQRHHQVLLRLPSSLVWQGLAR